MAPAHLVSGADRKKLGRRLEGLPGMPEGITTGASRRDCRIIVEPKLSGLVGALV